ncbi:MAG: T9SS type A sorting domain-containing protein [bacterium]|nr:T9SS type A sorting domain-containing protein [bacterium]
MPLLIILLLTTAAFAQFAPYSLTVSSDARARALDADPEPRLGSNVIIDILGTSDSARLWLGTGNGVTRLTLDLNSGVEDQRYQFANFGEAQGLGKGGISGLYVTDSIIWAAFAFDTTVGISGAGGGLAYSRNDGDTWTWLPQPRDGIYGLNRQTGLDTVLGYWPTATNVDNITYAFAMTPNYVWIVSKGGGLRKHVYAADYTDYQDTTGWRVVSPDGTPFNTGAELADRSFSITYDGTNLWVGTAAGIFRSSDEGESWEVYNANNSDISGNFVTALDYSPATNTVWAASWRAQGGDEFYAVSTTSNGGATWEVTLTEAQIEQTIGRRETPRIHGFAFDGAATYACDDIGLWKTTNGGASWELFPQIADSARAGHRFEEDDIYAALKSTTPNLLWTGGLDGLAASASSGARWHILQTAEPLTSSARDADTYAYPNPYSPSRYNAVRIRVSSSGGAATLTVYDFAMSEVVALPAQTLNPGEDYLTWDGRKDGVEIANGTYFYKVEKPGGEVWGKLIILD